VVYNDVVVVNVLDWILVRKKIIDVNEDDGDEVNVRCWEGRKMWY